MSFMPTNLTGVPVSEQDGKLEFIRGDYDRSHPSDTLDDLVRRARFDKHDKGLLREWLVLAAEREMQSSVANHLESLL